MFTLIALTAAAMLGTSGCQATSEVDTAGDAAVSSGDAASSTSVVHQALVPPEAVEDIGSLTGKKPPEMENLEWFVRDRKQAIALGKALFWDMQVGADGVQACASCHFSAGADVRHKNQINPGANGTFDAVPTGQGGPNWVLVDADFPLHRLVDPDDRNSPILFDSDDVVSSQGTFQRTHIKTKMSNDADQCEVVKNSIFHVGGLNTRQVQGRNTPTVINAGFNFRSFWDGRGNAHFNGVDPFGPRNEDAVVGVVLPNGKLGTMKVHNANGGPASQEVGPPLAGGEMACEGRAFADVGRKILWRRPLQKQGVDKTDSVLGEFRHSSGKGLENEYARYVRKAFRKKFWKTKKTVGNYKLIEANFALFFGIAVELYQKTLVSDQTPFDSFVDGNAGALSQQQVDGLNLFLNDGLCVDCHNTPVFSSASSFAMANGPLADRVKLVDGSVALADSGFFNIGVRATSEDLGVGGVGPYGNPLSYSRQAKSGTKVDDFDLDPCDFGLWPCEPVSKNERDAVDGAFKTPGLRNVELTGPFFHNGAYGTLSQVMQFYNRGGDRRDNPDGSDTSGLGANKTNVHENQTELGLDKGQLDSLVCFMQALTDERVRNESAPFDHPQLLLATGHPGNHEWVVDSGNGEEAADDLLDIPAVGAAGRSAKGLPPIEGFLPETAQCCTAGGEGIDLGVASDFNVFALWDYTGGLDVGGRVAVGGWLGMEGFSVGFQTSGTDVIITRSTKLRSGTAFGNLVYSNSVDLDETVDVTGSVKQGSPIDFVAAKAELETLGQQLKGRPTNGITSVLPWKSIELTGTDPVLNIFELKGSDLSVAVAVVVRVPPGATALVNVDGANVSIRNFQFFLEGSSPSRILWNLHEAGSRR